MIIQAWFHISSFIFNSATPPPPPPPTQNKKNNNNKPWKDTTNKCNINVAHDILIENNILSYDVTLKDNNLELINGSSKVRSISSGFMMCKRLTIEKMQSAFPRSKYIDNTGFLKSEEQQYAYALF